MLTFTQLKFIYGELYSSLKNTFSLNLNKLKAKQDQLSEKSYVTLLTFKYLIKL